MSAPLVINLKDGSVWERRAVTGDGVALYALAGSCKCPEFKMATEFELAALGIAGSADVLPVPVGPKQSARDRLRVAFIAALDEASRTHPCPAYGDQIWSGCVHYDDAGRVSGVGSCHSGRRADAVLAVRDAEVDRLTARITELEAELRTANGSLSDAAEALRANQCPCPPVSRPHQVGCPLDGVPDAVTRVFAPVASLREADVTPQVKKLRSLLAGQRAMLEDPHDSPLHHPYRVSHDLPETGGTR